MSSSSSCCALYKLVRWNIDFIKPELHVAFPEHEELIRDCVTLEEFRNEKVAQFACEVCSSDPPPEWRKHDYPPKGPDGKRRFPPEDGKYIHVYTEVLDCFEGESWDFEADQVALIDEIAATIAGEHRIRLPKTGLLSCAIDSKTSDFGDEFVNFPDFLGERPKAGETMLSGWLHFKFDKPKGDWAEFELTYRAVGTPVQIEWGGGQVFDFFQTLCFPTPFLNNLDTTNRGRLNLNTGRVEDLSIYCTFQGTTIGRTDKANRIPYAFPYIYPPLPLPPGFKPPKEYEPPIPPPAVFADLEFETDRHGNIIGVSLRSETFAPTGLFPFLPPMPVGFFPPFSWGRDFGFHFANPDRCLQGTPPEACPNDRDNPDGILRPPDSYSVYFHPHLNLVSRHVEAGEPIDGPPAGAPEALADSLTVGAGHRLYVVGGFDAEGVSGAVHIYDTETHDWHQGASLPQPVASAQGAVVEGRIYVLGGYTDAAGKVTNTVQVYDIAADSWSKKGKLDLGVAEATATAVDAKIYVVSGVDGKGRVTGRVQILDTASGKVGKGQAAAIPSAGASAVAAGRRVVVAGGALPDKKGKLSENSAVSERSAVYEIDNDLWALGPDLVAPTYDAVAARIDGLAFLIGGRNSFEGSTVAEVQQLDLAEVADDDRDRSKDQGWRRALPQPIPTGGSGSGAVGNACYVVGGRTMTGIEAAPGELSDLVQILRLDNDWMVSAERPAITAAGVFNQAGVAMGPHDNEDLDARSLVSPGCRAVILGAHLETVTGFTVGGLPGELVAPPTPQVLNVLMPTGFDTASGVAELQLESDSPHQAPPQPIAVADVAPGLYFYSFDSPPLLPKVAPGFSFLALGEFHEPAFLDNGPALVCNDDGSLNFADQPATPGAGIQLWATGLEGANKSKLEVRVRAAPGGRSDFLKATAVDIAPGPGHLPGVQVITCKLPKSANLQLSNNTPVLVTYDKTIVANRVVISIREKATRRKKPVPCEIGLFFVFGPPPPG